MESSSGTTSASPRARALRRHDVEAAQPSETQHVDAYRLGDAAAVEQPDQVIDAGHAVAIQADDEVARQESGAVGRPALLDRSEQRAEFVVDLGCDGGTARHR